jgi:hypothetical protein
MDLSSFTGPQLEELEAEVRAELNYRYIERVTASDDDFNGMNPLW